MEQTNQKYLGGSGLIIFIALLSAFVPLSTDLYLPALPAMSTIFGVSADQINLTLTAFFIFYALGTLIWGPMSDHFGRRPILITGLSIYVISSISCAFSPNINGLIISRIFQAVGGSAAGAVATAIVKDVYSGKKRGTVLAIVQSMVLISPAAAPVLGAYLLKVMSWRGVFGTLTAIGILAMIGSLLFEESIAQRTHGALLPAFGRIFKVLQNRRFTVLLILFSLGSVSSLAFIASSTYIYQDSFHLTGQMYSFYFAFNALGFILGPMIFLWLSQWHNSEKIIQGAYIVIAVSGLLVCFLGNIQPW
ncbi:MAG: Bcr/CflA family efflux MFS transporter, partial [Chloroflexota bacterium]